jgi:DNA-binding XRE family transcriptional regulator/predicted transcriptional regulator
MTADGCWAYYSARGIQALRLLAQGPLTVPELAEQQQVAARTARRMVAQLVRDGLVEEHPDSLRHHYRLARGGHDLGLLLVASAVRELESREAEHRALTVGQALFRYRRMHGITQARFAEMLGADYADYGHIERGQREVAGTEVMEFASHLGVDVLDLLTLRRGETPTTQRGGVGR